MTNFGKNSFQAIFVRELVRAVCWGRYQTAYHHWGFRSAGYEYVVEGKRREMMGIFTLTIHDGWDRALETLVLSVHCF